MNTFGHLDIWRYLSQIQQLPPHNQSLCTDLDTRMYKAPTHTHRPFPMIISLFPATLARVPPNFWWDPSSLGATGGSVLSIL